MATTVTSPQFSATLSAGLNNGASTYPKVSTSFTHQANGSYDVGSSAGEVNKAYSVDVNVNTSGATSIDLTTLTDAIGTSTAFGTVSAILITNKSTVNGQNITVGGGTNGLFAAWPVTLDATDGLETLLIRKKLGITVDGTHKILTLAAAAGAAVPVRVTILGR